MTSSRWDPSFNGLLSPEDYTDPPVSLDQARAALRAQWPVDGGSAGPKPRREPMVQDIKTSAMIALSLEPR